MNCSECRPLLDAYLDGELDVRSTVDLEAHLAGCSECGARHRALRRVSRAVRTHATRFTPPAGFEERLRAALPRDTGRGREGRRPRAWLALPVAAALVVGWMGGLLWSSRGAERALGEEVVAAHVRSLVGNHLTDVASSDRHTVNPWFQGKLPFAVGARDFEDRGFALVGGRLDYVAGRPVAALVYRHGAHLISVFLWPADSPVEGPSGGFPARGYHVDHWVQDGLTRWVVSDVDESALRELVGLLRAKEGT